MHIIYVYALQPLLLLELNYICFFVIITGKFGVVYKALYTSKENSTAIEVAVKTVKRIIHFIQDLILKYFTFCRFFIKCS